MEEGEIVELPTADSGLKDDSKRDERRTKWSALMGDVYNSMSGPSRVRSPPMSFDRVGEEEEGEYTLLDRHGYEQRQERG